MCFLSFHLPSWKSSFLLISMLSLKFSVERWSRTISLDLRRCLTAHRRSGRSGFRRLGPDTVRVAAWPSLLPVNVDSDPALVGFGGRGGGGAGRAERESVGQLTWGQNAPFMYS